MKKVWKSISTYVLVALISVGATYGTYSYLNKDNKEYTTPVGYGNKFDQENFHLASLTQSGYPDFTKAADNAIHAVVHIKSVAKQQNTPQSQRRMIDPFEFFFGNPGGSGRDYNYGSQQPAVGFGSGVIISKDGYIITNNHVIDKANEIEVTLNDNSKYTAKLIGTDPNTDIALLKIEAKDLQYIPFGDSDKLKVGEWVLAVGNPFNLTSTVTAGIVSAKGRGGIGTGDPSNIQSYIQTDAAINPGNSGGALINTDGQLIGINTAIYSQTGSFAGYGFAVPISIAGKVVADLKEFGAVQRAVLGVMMRDIAIEKELNPNKTKMYEKLNEGAYVSEFAEQSPAKQAGMEVGDVIVAVNDTKVKSASDLQEQISRFRPGDKVKVSVKRGNTDKTFDITLKNSSGNTSVVKKEDGLAAVGAAFKELTKEQQKEHGISYGVEVAGVDNSGKFHKYGISKGFIIQKINNQPVSTVAEVESLIQAAANSQEKVVFVSGFYPITKAKRYYAVELD
jgi:Do/DeqQ family serine protease